jgi:hypothetical protein
MTDQTLPQLPPSARLMDMIFGFALSRSIAVAAQLGIADLLGAGPKSADELAESTGANPNALYRLLRALAGAGIFTEETDGRFGLTLLSELLRSDVPESLRGFAAMMANTVNFETWAHLPYSIETGKPAFPHKFGMPWFTWLGENPAEAKAFHDAMTSLSASAIGAVVSAYDFSGIKRLVDVGGGHGLLLASVLAKYADMRGVLYDAPVVVQGSKDVLVEHEVADRCEAVVGDFFQSVPAGGDAYILKHIIHDWSDEECLTILGHCHSGTTPGGRVLIVEMVIPEPNVPSVGKFLDLQMLLFLSGRERTATEYRSLLDRAGYDLTKIVPTPSAYSVIEGIRR